MKAYDASSTIGAAPEVVWAILTDAPGYSKWDSGVERVEGRIAPGEKITVVSKANPGRAFPVKVSEFEPGRRMVWSAGCRWRSSRASGPSVCRPRATARQGSRSERSTRVPCFR
jgi:uncharacterized protein YndB with AHSA1/START domain